MMMHGLKNPKHYCLFCNISDYRCIW